MKSAPFSIAVSLTLLAAPLLHSAESPKKSPSRATPAPAKGAAPVAKTATPGPEGAPAGEPSKVAYPEVVAVVEGKEIKAAELQEAVAMILARKGAKPADVPEDQQAKFFHMVLDQLIMTKIVEKRAAGFKLPEAEVTAELDKLKTQFASEAEFNEKLAAGGQTLDALKESIRGQLRPQRWVESQVKEAKKITEADAEEFYKQNPNEFKKPEQVRASHILIAVPQDATPAVVIEKEKAAKSVVARVKGGEDFAKVAKEVSEDPSSKDAGGDLDFFTKEAMGRVPQFADAAFALKKDAVSDPVRSPAGYHIIKVTDRKDAEDMSLESVKPRLVAYLQAQEQQTAIAKILQELKAGAEVKVSLP